MYIEIQHIVHDEGGVVVPMFTSDLSATSDKIGYGPIAANWELDGFRAAERYWFKS